MKITILGQEYVLLTQAPLLDTTENFSFATDVHQAVDSTEYRLPLIDYARQSFNYSLLSYKQNVAGMFSTFHEALRSQYLIPQMLEKLPVGSIAGDFIVCDTSLLSISAETFVLIKSGSDEQVAWVESIGRYQLVDDEQVYQDGYQLDRAVTATSAVLQPLRRCIIDGDASNQMNGLVFKPKVTFRILDAVEYIAAEAPEQHLGQDYYDWCVLLNGDFLDISFNQHQVIVDGGLGNIWSYSNWDHAKKMFNLRILLRGMQEYIDFKKWFYRRRGRLNAFYLPMFEGNHDNKVIRLYRLNSDALELQFRGAGIVECTVPLIEVSA